MSEHKKIAIIDDDTLIRKSVVYLLLDKFQVFSYGSVAEFLEALEAEDAEVPDLILLDIMMPGVDGVEFVRRIRDADQANSGKGEKSIAYEKLRDVIIIMVSARGDIAQKAELSELGVADYISKPFSMELLEQRIVNALAK
jgi:DNA-binding response OmpR family regulator